MAEAERAIAAVEGRFQIVKPRPYTTDPSAAALASLVVLLPLAANRCDEKHRCAQTHVNSALLISLGITPAFADVPNERVLSYQSRDWSSVTTRGPLRRRRRCRCRGAYGVQW